MIKKITIGVLSLLIPIVSNATINTNTADQPAIQQYIQTLVEKYNFKQHALEKLFAHFEPNEQIIASMNKPYEEQPWSAYRKVFLQPQRISGGVAFWQKHKKELTKAQAQYGVPASIIVAILGVETMYGEHTGNYSVFNSLATLAFNYPQRATFFKDELTNYLLLSNEEHFPALQAKGSYAGAMGMMQFMPSNIRKYGVDTSGNKAKSAIFSIANFLKDHGWQNGQAVAAPVGSNVNPNWFSDKANQYQSSQAINRAGIATPKNISKASFVKLPEDPTSSNWMVYKNFDIIMRYNPRIAYAMAVYQLSQAIDKAMPTTHG
jgi:membrane-bound lytic murein transglycosylase B